MTRHIIFFQGGGGEDDHMSDSKLVHSLKTNLGPGCSIHYPLLPDNGAPDMGRREQIIQEVSASKDDVILIGHSLGASMLLAVLTENKLEKQMAGIFLLATPFWKGDEDWVKPFKLQPEFDKQLDRTIPLYFYHCCDDEEVPVSHLTAYRRYVPWASFREIPFGGHQFNNDLEIVAKDIGSIWK
jgi:hypothetical protein